MEEQIKMIFTNIEILNKLIENNQYNIILTWTILGIIIAVLALAGAILIKGLVNFRVTKELKPIKLVMKDYKRVGCVLLIRKLEGF